MARLRRITLLRTPLNNVNRRPSRLPYCSRGGRMLPQEAMIEKVRQLCHRDERVVSALMYGSFAIGEGDRFSDIEFYLFFEDEAAEGLEEEAWVAQVAPLALYYVNEFGNGTAIFENLVRGEFHFEAASNVGLVDAWENAWFH